MLEVCLGPIRCPSHTHKACQVNDVNVANNLSVRERMATTELNRDGSKKVKQGRTLINFVTIM